MTSFSHLSPALVGNVVDRHNQGATDKELASYLNQSAVPTADRPEKVTSSWSPPLVGELLDQAADGRYRNLRLRVDGRS